MSWGYHLILDCRQGRNINKDRILAPDNIIDLSIGRQA